MPQIPIIMPQLGESIAEATVVRLLVNAGDQVAADQDVMEVETNKATMNVASPCPGRVQKWQVKLRRTYARRATSGYPPTNAPDISRLARDQTTGRAAQTPALPELDPPSPL